MCGFVGYFGKGNYEREMIVDKMGELIAHRGPDSAGIFTDEEYAVAFRRLSIIDLEGSPQPMHSQDGRYVITFNGEIYNYKELREDLEKNHGCTFVTSGDTETILQTYMVYGEETASKLRGMFAFVIYDKQEHKMYGARDHFGIKPFYYGMMNDHFFFGSEIKSFLAHPAFEKEINKDAVKMYLIFQYSVLPETLFKNVYKLTPGYYFTYDGENFETTQYFDATYETVERTYEETIELIDKTVLESVDYHLIADVEVGSFLSAGVDSSFIASTARPDKTYTVGFGVEGFDETIYAKELCDILDMKSSRKQITPDEFFDALPKVQYHSDEPHANLSAVPLYFLAELAAKDVKVVLSGEGADEFFGGYDNYKPSKEANLYQKFTTRGMRRAIANWAKGRPYFKGQGFLIRNVETLEEGYVGQAFIMNNEEADEILAPAYASKMRYQDVTKPYFDRVKDADEIRKKMFIDMHLWLPNDILLKADKMTMAHSLEGRVPYLDKEVWALARTIDTKYAVREGQAKKAFRTAALTHIPEEWAKRKKLGFMVPFRVWIKEEKYYNIVKECFMRDYVSDFFNREILLKWLEDHYTGKDNYARKIYTVYAFLLWYEQYFVIR